MGLSDGSSEVTEDSSDRSPLLVDKGKCWEALVRGYCDAMIQDLKYLSS